jgi:rhodanese-related sulfurtransferase
VVNQSAIDALLAQARAVLDRVEPRRLNDELAAGAVLIDIRPFEQRQRDGELTGAIIIDRNVLEWRLDPTSPDRLPVASSADIRYILVCNQGYSSSLAAATLRDLGLSRATDLVGGFQAFLAYQDSPQDQSSVSPPIPGLEARANLRTCRATGVAPDHGAVSSPHGSGG